MPRTRRQLPPPLPPETRTVGQLVAETIRLYGRRFWPSLALGVAPALLAVASTEWKSNWALTGIAVGAGLANSACYVAACSIVAGRRPDRVTALSAFLVGIVVFTPIPFLGIALVGLAVPAIVIERRPLSTAFQRGWELVRADAAHAVGGI